MKLLVDLRNFANEPKIIMVLQQKQQHKNNDNNGDDDNRSPNKSKNRD
jgi:hypothetical protein